MLKAVCFSLDLKLDRVHWRYLILFRGFHEIRTEYSFSIKSFNIKNTAQVHTFKNTKKRITACCPRVLSEQITILFTSSSLSSNHWSCKPNAAWLKESIIQNEWNKSFSFSIKFPSLKFCFCINQGILNECYWYT